MVFLQNGMGTIEEVVKLFPGDDEELPCMIKGITNHGCKRSHMELFTVHHTSALGQGEVVFGVASARHGGRPSAVQALETLGQMSQLGARVVDADSILHIQRQKLLVNACINPLTALLGCTNGGLLMSQDAKRLSSSL